MIYVKHKKKLLKAKVLVQFQRNESHHMSISEHKSITLKYVCIPAYTFCATYEYYILGLDTHFILYC